MCQRKKSIRAKQLEIAIHSPMPFLKMFIDGLKCETSERNYFLHNLKLLIDSNIQELTQIPPDQTEENKMNESRINSSVGLEHILRELGQVYEATWQTTERHKYQCLPQIAADLLISGHPLELMDGDASHVPMIWIENVMQELNQTLKNPRVFVISILGLQSSGKSTLLNTMFGLHFSVSAGRCTRGAYM